MGAAALFLGPMAGTGDALTPGAPFAALAAQVPDTLRTPPRRLPPQLPDSLRRPIPTDTMGRILPVGGDTVPADTLGPPPPTLPDIDPLGPVSWARGVWEWDREALRRLPALSLMGLLERLPGVVPLRADILNQAESGALFGAAGGAIRYVIDGYELDPLVAPTFDASRLPLLAFDRIRVERWVTGITVRAETVSPDHPRSRSIVEAGTGDYGVNLFRGLFLAPAVLGGPLALGFERLGSDGVIPAGGSNHLAGWVKWSWIRDSAGIQLEYRQSDMDRSGVSTGLVGARRDWAVRARATRGGVIGEVYGGASTMEDELGDVVLREGSPQAGLRLASTLDVPLPLDVRAAVRLRGHPRLPAQEIELGFRARPVPLLALEGEAVQGWWPGGEGSGHWGARAQAGPLLGVMAFGELSRGRSLFGGEAGLRLPAANDSLSVAVARDGARVGLEGRWGGLLVGGAAIRSAADTSLSLGLRTEPRFVRMPAVDVAGFEIMTRIPTGWRPLSLQGWYVRLDAPGQLYVPEHQWRAGVVYHHSPLPSDNLEIYLRAEHQFRGRMPVPAPLEEGTPGGGPALTEVLSYRATNLELTIRVITLRAFLRWENVRHRRNQQDLAGFLLPGQRILYGVKWDFLN